MARSRKTPPLFEVMRETDRKAEERRAPGQGIPARPTEPAGGRARSKAEEAAQLRLSPTGSGAAGGAGGRAPESAHAHDDPGHAPMGQGLVLAWPVLLGGAGVLVAVVAVIAMLAFNAGARREQEQLLPKDGEPPIVGRTGEPREGDPVDPLNIRGASVERPAARGAGEEAKAPPRANRGGAGALPVFGEDPREQGKNYLVVERLMFDDAMGAAQFLTDNGVASVVVAPEGVKVSDLQQQPRGIWLVIVRAGFTRDEFRANAAGSEEIKNAVVKLGRRWKQDHKGPTNFANCYWNKFGK